MTGLIGRIGWGVVKFSFKVVGDGGAVMMS